MVAQIEVGHAVHLREEFGIPQTNLSKDVWVRVFREYEYSTYIASWNEVGCLYPAVAGYKQPGKETYFLFTSWGEWGFNQTIEVKVRPVTGSDKKDNLPALIS